MSLTDNNVLPALYESLATPPLSPVPQPASTRKHRAPSTPLHSVVATPNLSPVHLNSPLISRRSSVSAATKIALPAPSLPDPAVYEPINSAPRSLHPAQFSPHPKPARLHRYPTQLHVDTSVESLTREKKGKMPALSHLLNVGGGRVLALAADGQYVYAGCQSADNEIVVFSRNTLQPMFRLLGHQGSIMALMIIEEKGSLVSSSSAGDVRIWCTQNLEPLHIIHPCDDTAGDVYSLAWDGRNGGTLYFGTQGATIEWINFSPKSKPNPLKQSTATANASITVPVLADGTSPSKTPPVPPTPGQRSGRYKPHYFFDKPSTTPSGANTPASPQLSTDFDAMHISRTGTPRQPPVDELEVAVEDRLSFAHYGYVYALQIVDRPDGSKWLVSGSGDSDVKIWKCAPGGGLCFLKGFSDLSGGVLSFAYRDSLLYAGLQDGEILIWDLETGACIRTIEAHESDVMSMSVLGGEVYTAAADGRVLRLDQEFDCTAAFKAHQGIVLGSTIVKGLGSGWDLITAGNDSYVKIWSIDYPQSTCSPDREVQMEGEGDVMLYALSKLISVPTVSDDAHRESCRQGAHLLKKILGQLGASAEVLSGEQGRNPLVLATFSATSPADSSKPRRRLLFYGHYDVQPAAEELWETNPWELSGRNGYLYGRGVSDNKGPILAVACAAATLRRNRELEVDVVLLIEGEEEAGSRGFASTVRKNKESIGHIDTILLSNSTWINEENPCVVYGMRGVVYANLTISSGGADAHSGVDGGMVAEPMFDMVRVLGGIGDAKGVKLPNFYDNVRPQSPAEMNLLSDVAKACGRPIEELDKIWRQPSFSIANITTSSASSNKTVIPKRVTADISMRLVPDQELKVVVAGLKRHCQEMFDELKSANTFEMNITHHASWWLASLDNPYFKALESSVEEVWGQKPLKIREGGTVPTIFWLEAEFGAPCVHLPLGQASDAGHLANERMRLLNLRNGKRVVELYLGKVANV